MEINSKAWALLLAFILFLQLVSSMTGSGSESDPYVISNCVDLQNMRRDSLGHFVIGTDIDCYTDTHLGGIFWNNGKGFHPINVLFKGTLDGQNHTVSGLLINWFTDDYSGLFSRTDGALIKNLILDVNVRGEANAGGIVGYALDSNFENIQVRGNVYCKNSYCGGLFGKIAYGSVTNSKNFARIDGNSYVGGIVGKLFGTTIRRLSNSGAIKGIHVVGGISGNVSSMPYAISLFNSGNINSTGNSIGGIFGSNSGEEQLSSAYNTGNIISTGNYVGGIFGSQNYYDGVGGATLVNSYNTGKVQGHDYVGGIAGKIYSPIKGCFNTGVVIGQTPNRAGIVAGYRSISDLIDIFLYNAAGGNIPTCDPCTNIDSISYFFNRSSYVYNSLQPFWNNGEWIWNGNDYPKLCWVINEPCVPFTYDCLGSFNNAHILAGESSGLGSDSQSVLLASASLATTQKCEWVCDDTYYYSTANGGSCVPYTCQGPAIANATRIAGDDIGLTQNNIQNSLVLLNTSAKCEWICNNFYHKESNVCVRNTCSTIIDSNSLPYSGDNTDVPTHNMTSTLTSTNTSEKCQYYCKNGFYQSGNSCLLYSCTGTISTTAPLTVCPGDNVDLTSDLTKILVETCDSTRKCQYLCGANYHFSIVGGNRTCVQNTYQCLGTHDGNSIIYEGDGAGLTSDTQITLSDTNTSAKCQYHCIKNFVLNEAKNKCIPNLFICTGINEIDSNAVLYDEDNLDLTSNTISKLVASNTSNKCEYGCKSGFYKGTGVDENKCLPNNYYCTGSIDSNAVICPFDNIGLDANTANSLVLTCSDARKCEWVCGPNYVKGTGYDQGKCVKKISYSCEGEIDPNAVIYADDDEELTSIDNRTNTLSFENTSLKCEWHCKDGYYLADSSGGYVCVKEEESEFFCTGVVDSNSVIFSGDSLGLDSNLSKVLVDVNTSRKCEFGCKSGFYLGFVSGVGVCLPKSFSCKGSVFGGVVYFGDDSGLTSDLNVVLVGVNTSRKCEYHCASGYDLVGGACVLKNVVSAVCGNAERGFGPDELFFGSFSLCSIGVPSVASPVLSNAVGSIVNWICISDINAECSATRVSSKYNQPIDEGKNSSNSILKVSSEMSEDGNINITLKCEKTAVVNLSVTDYLSNKEYPLNQSEFDCSALGNTYNVKLNSEPTTERSIVINASMDANDDCSTCKLNYFMDFVPVKKQNEENYIWFILLGLMVLAIVGLGAFMIINKVKKV